MGHTQSLNIAVFPGDGIGPEITAPCLELLQNAARRVGGFQLEMEALPAGAACYRDTGESLPKRSMEIAKKADAILLSAMGLPHIRYEDGTEISPQLDLRFELGLYAGVRPVRAIPGIPAVLAHPLARELDFVLIRESTEGLFASHGKGRIEANREARDTLVITREVSEKLFDFAFHLAVQRRANGNRGKVTCVDKANVFSSFAFFRSIFDERAKLFADIVADHAYVDAVALNMVRNPWIYDVLVTENMFGDILSDLGAGLIGGMGMAPSGDIGDEHAVFQPCHGSAPDIAGQGMANPTAMFLSAAMMMEWLGVRENEPRFTQTGQLIRSAVDAAFAKGDLLPTELGGSGGTKMISGAVLDQLRHIAIDTIRTDKDREALHG